MHKGAAPPWSPQRAAARCIVQATVIEREAVSRLDRRDHSGARDALREVLSTLNSARQYDSDAGVEGDLRRVGACLHEVYGCQYKREGSSYVETCPVKLGRIPFGSSIGGSAASICSICGKSGLDCPHLPGHVYDGVEARFLDGMCNICCEENGCDHTVGSVYNDVICRRVITRLDLDHIALVAEPDDPQARLNAVLVPPEVVNRLADDMGPEGRAALRAGRLNLLCHECVSGPEADRLWPVAKRVGVRPERYFLDW